MISRKLKDEEYARAGGYTAAATDGPKAPPRTIEVSKRAIVIAVVIVLVLVIAAIVMTQVLPKGAYERAIDADGNVVRITTGTHWTPETDPYSIPAGGDVVRAFAAHGFAWGGDALSSKRDYMHFSYFGT